MIVSEREEDNGLDCINMQNYFFIHDYAVYIHFS